LVVIADPAPESWSSVVAALVDALDIVLLRPRRRVSLRDARRLTARARERGSVLVVLGDAWPEATDVRLSVVRATWEGIGDGYGHLQARRAVLGSSGRRSAARVKPVGLWLPAAGGGAPGGAGLDTELAA